jgi:hypothetical protein
VPHIEFYFICITSLILTELYFTDEDIRFTVVAGNLSVVKKKKKLASGKVEGLLFKPRFFIPMSPKSRLQGHSLS